MKCVLPQGVLIGQPERSSGIPPPGAGDFDR